MSGLATPRRFAAYVAIGITLVLFPRILPAYMLTLLISILIFAIYAGSFNLLYGYNGRISVGHATFWGAGAYAVAILTTRGILGNFYLVLLATLIIATVLGAIIGLLVNRARGVYFMILTFAFGHIFYCLAAYVLTPLTGGEDGVKGIVRPDLGLPWSMARDQNFYYLVLVIFLLSFFLFHRIIRSPFGFTLVGIRENERRMLTLGYNVQQYKYVCYILSSIFAGLAGSLYAYFALFVSSSELHWFCSGEVILMVLMGGIGTLWGPVLGATLFTLLRYYVSIHTDHWLMVLGLVLILIVLLLPRGIIGFFIEVRRGTNHGSTTA
jgi:branched-chain amino acid transport system permease protein